MEDIVNQKYQSRWQWNYTFFLLTEYFFMKRQLKTSTYKLIKNLKKQVLLYASQTIVALDIGYSWITTWLQLSNLI